MKRRKNQGFSLVELIVVIAVMAILVGVAVPIYSSYIDKAKETKDEEYLANLSKTAQLFAAENGLELDSVWVAPEVKEDRGIELVLKGGKVFEGDMSSFYAMLGGAYNFETIEKKQNIVYREDDVPSTEVDQDSDNVSCEHLNMEATSKKPTCTESGFKHCDTCGYHENLTASGHKTSVSRTVGNLTVYTCERAGCDFVEVRFEGNQIGG